AGRRTSSPHPTTTTLAPHYEFDLETRFESLPEAIRQRVLYGSGTEEIPFLYINEKGRSTVKKHPFEGVIPNLERRWRETDSSAVRADLGRVRHTELCSACQGARRRTEARRVRLGDEPGEQERRGRPICEVEARSLLNCLEWFEKLDLQGARKEVAERIIREIVARLRFLNNVGLSYLSLDRSADTISGGERSEERRVGRACRAGRSAHTTHRLT